MKNEIVSLGDIDNIYEDISDLIQQKKNNVKTVVNDAMDFHLGEESCYGKQKINIRGKYGQI